MPRGLGVLLRHMALTAAYAIAVLLATVWVSAGLASLHRPLFDLGNARIGDAIIGFADLLALPPEMMVQLAHLLAGLKLLLGLYLLAALILAIAARVRCRTSGDEIFDLGLFASAVASIVAAGPAPIEGEALRVAVGELMLCALASGLAQLGRAAPAPTSATISPASRNA